MGRIQEKIASYTNILIGRYSPGIVFYRISAGYIKSSEAINDLTPLYIIYTSTDLTPNTGDTIYTDSGKSTIIDGNDLWYHVFGSDGSDRSYIILINKIGIVTNKFTIT